MHVHYAYINSNKHSVKNTVKLTVMSKKICLQMIRFPKKVYVESQNARKPSPKVGNKKCNELPVKKNIYLVM